MHGIARYTLRTTTRLRPSWCQGQAFEHNFIFHIFCKCSPGALYYIIYIIYIQCCLRMCGTNNGGAILQAILSWWFSFHVLFAFAFGSNEATRSGVNLSLPQPTSRTILSWGGNVKDGQLRSTRCEYPCRHYCSCQWLQLDWIAGTTILTMPSPVVWIRTMHDDVWRCSDAAQTILLSAGWFTCAGFGDGWDCLAKSLDG